MKPCIFVDIHKNAVQVRWKDIQKQSEEQQPKTTLHKQEKRTCDGVANSYTPDSVLHDQEKGTQDEVASTYIFLT